MRTALFLVLSLSAMGAVAACGGGGDGGTNICFSDESRFRDVEVSPGTTPTFRWCGAPAKSLVVRNTASSATTWDVECGTNPPLCVTPPVAYGDTIPATTIQTPPAPLQAGTPYELCLLGVSDRPPTLCTAFTP